MNGFVPRFLLWISTQYFLVRCSVRQARALAISHWNLLQPVQIAQVSFPAFLYSVFDQIVENLGNGTSPYQVYPLSPGYYYRGPSLGYGDGCLCSSVYYSMQSACATCQGGDIPT